MRNLLSLIFRFSALILFIFLEIVSFYLIVNYNKSQKEIWTHSSNLVSGSMNERLEGVENFFEMQKENDSLMLENAKLLETIINYRVSSKDNAFEDYESNDSLLNYTVIPTRVCAKTINLRNNYLTLCKGSQSGIEAGMGVISKNGVVGIVKSVTKNYATVLMILNSQSRTSAKINSKNYHGNLVWESDDPRTMTLVDVPKHAEIAIGDSISTSGYSICYPPDIYIGEISNYEILGNSYNIDVKLNYDLAKLEYVYVIAFKQGEEKELLLEVENE